MSESESMRIIKKYPNRRLYDTQLSAYVTLDHIRELVLASVPFRVVSAKTQEDLTHSTLLQLIMEQEGAGQPLLSNTLLENFIRLYAHSIQDNLKQFTEQMEKMVSHNLSLWKSFLDKTP